MNKIYKLKFSKALNQLIVVSELADNREVKATSSTRMELDLSALQPAVSVYNLSSVSKLINSVFAIGAGAGLLATASTSYALTGANVVSGDVSIAKNGSVTTITNSPGSIINWESFNIGKDEIVKFIQQSANSAVLNRVLGKQASEILGSLQSNGRVFLINPNGILFGKSATVNVAELVASTLDITNEDFTAGRYVFNQEKDTTIASVLNQGMIQVNDDGSLALIGGNVLNNGVLQARNGSIYLLAGKSITIADLDNPLISYKVAASNRAVNLGQIISKRVNMLGAKVAHGATSAFSYADIFTQANTSENTDLDIKITARGEVELFAGSTADQFQTNQQSNAEVVGEKQGLVVSNATIAVNCNGEQAGKVRLLGDYVATEANSAIYAAGGTVFVGGDTQGKGTTKLAQVTRQQQTSVINVSNQGNAGTAIVWGNYLYADGRIDAKSVTGKGGFVETSGKGLRLAETLVISTESNKGRADYGTWLIDPKNIYVYHNETDKPASFTATASGTANPLSTNGGTAYKTADSDDNLYIQDTQIANYLNSTALTLTADNTISFLSGVNITTTQANAFAVTADNITAVSSTFVVKSLSFTANNISLTDTKACVSGGNLFKAEFATSGVFTRLNLTSSGDDNNKFELIAKDQSTCFSVQHSNLTVSGGNGRITLKSNKAEIDVNDSHFKIISGGGTATDPSEIVFAARGGDVKVRSSRIENLGTNINISGDQVFIFDTNFSSKGRTNISALTGFLNLTNTNLSIGYGGYLSAKDATNGYVNFDKVHSESRDDKVNTQDIIATKTINVTNSNFNTNVNTTFSGNIVNVTNSTLVASKGDSTEILLNLTANESVNLKDSTLKSSRLLEVTTTGTGGLVNVTNSTLTTKFTGDNGVHTKVNGATVCVTDSNISSMRDVFIRGTTLKFNNSNLTSFVRNPQNDRQVSVGDTSTVTIESTDSNFTTGIGKNHVNFHGTSAVTISGGRIEAGQDVNISSPTSGIAKLGSAAVTAGRSINITAHDVKLETGSSLTAKTSFHVEASNDINVTGAVINSEGNATLKAAQCITVSEKAKITGTNVSAESTAGSVELSDSEFIATANDGKINVTAQSSVYFRNGTNLSAKSDINVTSQDQTIDLTGTNISSTNGGNVKLQAKGQISSENSNVSGNDITLNSSEGKLTLANLTATASHDLTLGSHQEIELAGVKGTATTSLSVVSDTSSVSIKTSGGNEEDDEKVKSSLSAGSGTAKIQANTDVTLGDGTKISGAGDVTVKSVTTAVTATGTNISSTSGTAKVEAPGAITLTNSNISGASVEVSSSGATVNLENTTLNSTSAAGSTKVKAQQGLTLTNSKAQAAKDVEVKSEQSSVTATGSNITATSGKAKVEAQEDITLTNSNISGGSLEITSSNSDVTVNNSTLGATAEAGTATIKAQNALSLGNGTKVSAPGDVTVKSETSTVSVTGTNISSNSGTAKVEALGAITLTNSNISGASVDVNSSGATVNLDNTTLNSTSADGSTKVKAQQGLTLTNSKAQAAKDVEVKSEQASVTATGSNITATEGTATVTAPQAITLTNSNISGASIDVNSTEAGVTLNNSTLGSTATDGSTKVSGQTAVTLTNGTKVGAQGDATVESRVGSLTATGSNVTSVGGTATVKAQESVTLTNSNVSGANTEVKSENKGLTLTGNSTVDATTGTTLVQAKEAVSLENGTKVAGNAGTTVKSVDSTVTATGSNITSKAGTAKVEAPQAITLTNSNISGASIDVNSTQAGVTLNNSTLGSTATDGSTKVSGQTAVTLTNGTKVGAQGDATVESRVGSLTATGSNVTSVGGTATVKAQESVTLTNSNVSGANTEVKSENKGLTLTGNSTVEATTGTTLVQAKEAVNLENGTKVAGNGGATVKSEDSTITATGSNITSASGLTSLVAPKDITLSNSNISGASLNVQTTSDDGSIIVKDNTTLGATNGPATIKAKNNVLLQAGTKVTGSDNIDITSDNEEVSVLGTNITSDAGTVSLKAKKAITLDNSNISGAGISLNSTDADIATQNNTSLKATKDPVKIKAETGITLGNGTKVASENGANIESLNGTLTVVGTNITSAAGEVALTAKEEVTLKNSNISGGSIEAKSTNASLIVTGNTSLDATTGVATIKAKENVLLENGSKVKAQGNLNLNSENASVSVLGSNLTSTAGKVNLTAKEDITLVNSNISGAEVIVNSTNASVATTGNTSLAATKGDVTVKGDKDVTLGNGTQVKADRNLNIESPNGTANVTGTNLTAPNGQVRVAAKENVSINNSNITGKDINLNSANGSLSSVNSTFAGKDSITLNSKEDITLDNTSGLGGNIIATTTNGSITTTNNTSLDAKTGNLNANAKKDIVLGNGTKVNAGGDNNLVANGSVLANGTNISAGGVATITAKENISLTNSNISGNDVKLNATNTLKVANSSIDAQPGSVNLVGDKAVDLGNGTKVQALKDIGIASPNGSVAVTGTNLTAGGNVSLVAKENITLSNSNISANNITGLAKNYKSSDSLYNAANTVRLASTDAFDMDNDEIKAPTLIKLDTEKGPATISNTEGSAKVIELPEKEKLSEDNNQWHLLKDKPQPKEGQPLAVIPDTGVNDIAKQLGVVNPVDTGSELTIGNIVDENMGNPDDFNNFNNPSNPSNPSNPNNLNNPNNAGSVTNPNNLGNTNNANGNNTNGNTNGNNANGFGNNGGTGNENGSGTGTGSGAGANGSNGNNSNANGNTSNGNNDNNSNNNGANSGNSGSNLDDATVAHNTVRGVGGRRLSSADFEKFAEEEANNPNSAANSATGTGAGAGANSATGATRTGSTTGANSGAGTGNNSSSGTGSAGKLNEKDNPEGKTAKVSNIISSDEADSTDNSSSANSGNANSGNDNSSTASDSNSSSSDSNSGNSNSNNNSNISNADSSDASTEGSAAESSTGGISSCSLSTGNLYDKYNVPKQDREKLSLQENVKKYRISDTDVREANNNCSENNNNLQNQLNKLPKTSKK